MRSWSHYLVALLCSVTLTNELRNPRIRSGQRFFVRQEHDAEVLCAWLLAEAGAVDYHDVLLADEFFDEEFVTFRGIDFGESIKSPAGRDAAQARRGLAPFLREVAAGAQFAAHFNEVVLRAFERGLDRILLGMVGAEARAQ